MTLYRQLLLFTLTLFFVLLIVTWVEKLQSTRTFLIDQMESHAQDTATSLGLSLSPAMAQNDIATVETMMNAVFDRGYYRVISLVGVQGEVITERVIKVQIAGVPAWFVENISLKTPRVQALVMAGWNQAGTLYIESHPGYAYKTLWDTVVKITAYFSALGLLVIVIGVFGLKRLLRPLAQVELQAEAICRKEYHIQKILPKTRELRQVVETMNRMTNKVRDMFDEQAQTAEGLRKNAYSDQVTSLGNRRYLKGQVEASLTGEKSSVSGAFLLVQIHELQKINEENGFEAGDELLKKIAEIIRREMVGVGNVAMARLTGGDFAVFIPEIGADDTHIIAEKMTSSIARLAVERIAASDNLTHVGGVTYDQESTFADLLSGADTALRAAQQLGPNKWLVNATGDESEGIAKGKTWWKDTLDKVLEKGDILLYGQSVHSIDRKGLLHREIFARIALKDGVLISAGVFIPLAERLQLVSKLDRIVLEKAMKLTSDESIAVNISPSSLADKEFSSWLVSALGQLDNEAPTFAFEFAEFSAVQYLDVVKEFGAKVKALGHTIGLDHFGQSFSNFGYLKSLHPDYVKIDRGYTNELADQKSDSRFFISSLCSVAHSLDILVIAEGVELEEQLAVLQELSIDGVQGYLMDKPGKL